jgi:hypothetical protein
MCLLRGRENRSCIISCYINLRSNNTMNFSADPDAKLTVNIKTGSLFSGNTTNFGGGAPHSKGIHSKIVGWVFTPRPAY